MREPEAVSELVPNPILARINGEESEPAIGLRLREFRKRARMSLADLAAASGRSIGYLSQIERGLSSPTLREVGLLAKALGVGFVDLIDPPPPMPKASPVRRDHDRLLLPFRGSRITKRLLSPPNGGSIELFLMELQPGASTGPNLYSHEGEEAGYVVTGRIELRIGEDRFDLDTGDSFSFPSRTPHAYSALGDAPASVICVTIGHR
jgi:transcriptional regulator with XRE-family HTH domain